MRSPAAALQKRFRHWRWDPPIKSSALVLFVVTALVLTLVGMQFRGFFDDRESLTVTASRSGLSMDPDSKVTFNGVEIGKVARIDPSSEGGVPQARITLSVEPKFLRLIPANADVELKASTVFGNKFVSLSSPAHPDAARVSPSTPLHADGVTTEFNTLFETVVSVAQQFDPIKLNETLTATAQALDGLGTRFGESIENGNTILADVNPLMPQVRNDIRGVADLADVYAGSAPDLFDGLTGAATTARAVNDNQRALDAALMASVGFGNTGGDVVERSRPYLVRGSADLLSTTQLLDEYSPELFCTIRNYHDEADKFSYFGGGKNGYSLILHNELMGAPNPWVYPDNLPRVNAHGGPEGRPGCWQPVTRDLWPAPYLVMDTGASIAPYNHLELGQPLAIDYVCGRQVGENTINP